jgi:hypothetical protein
MLHAWWGSRTTKMVTPLYSPIKLREDEGGLGLRRSPFRLASDSYGNFFERETLPSNDTGIVTLTVRRDILTLTLPP